MSKWLLILYFLFGLLLFGTSLYTNPREKPFFMTTITSSCTRIALKGFLSRRRYLNIVLTDSDISVKELFETLYHSYNILLINETFVKSRHVTENRFLIIARNVTKLYEFFNDNLYKLKTCFYVLLTNFNGDEMSHFVQYLWRSRYTNVGFLEIKENGNVIISKYNKSYSGQNTMKLSVIAECNSEFLLDKNRRGMIRSLGTDLLCPPGGCKLKFWRVLKEEYPPRIIDWVDRTTYEVCNFLKWKYSYFETDHNSSFRGYESNQLLGFAHKYNISIEEMDLLKQVTWDEALRSLDADEIDIIFGYGTPKLKLYPKYSVSNWIRYEEIYFLGKELGTSKAINFILSPFESTIWVYTAVSAIFYNCFVILIKIFYRLGLIKEQLHCIDCFKILFGESSKLPKKTSLRFVSGLWIVTSFLLVTIYTCNFQIKFTYNENTQILGTLQQLINSNRTFGGFEFYHRMIENMTDPLMQQIYERYKVFDREEFLQIHLSDNYDTFLAVNQISLDITKFNNFYRKFAYHLITDPIIKYPIFFYMKSGHPYKKFIDHLIKNEMYGGILMKPLKIQTYKENLFDLSPKTLTLNKIFVILQILGVGACCSIIVFLIEYLMSCVQDRKCKTINVVNNINSKVLS